MNTVTYYMVREYSSIIIVKPMNTVTNTWYENTYPVLLQNKWTQILIHGKRILIHYYCKDKWTQLPNTWYENTYPVLLQRQMKHRY